MDKDEKIAVAAAIVLALIGLASFVGGLALLGVV
jgi:hypothetical protein